LKAAQDLGVPIYYIILSELTEEDIPTFQVQNSWKLEDYLKFYRSSNHDYEFVGKMMEKFKLKTNFVINCCGSVSYPERMFRNGTYKITKDKNRLEECFGKFKEVFDSCRVICGKDVDEVSVAGCYAIWSLVNHKEYDHERMLAKCDKNKSEVSIAFEFRERAHIFTRLLDLYNLNTKKGRIAAPAALKKKGAKYVED
jgi:phage pi2 protein 07